jgi:hypothetical protein
MKCLSRLYNILDANREPGCSKNFLKQVYRMKGKLKIAPHLLETGTDSRPLLKHNIIQQDEDGRVDLTDEARAIMG